MTVVIATYNCAICDYTAKDLYFKSHLCDGELVLGKGFQSDFGSDIKA